MKLAATARGFTLIEVVAALAVLGGTLLGLAGTLTTAIGRLSAAHALDAALASAGAVAATIDGVQAYPTGAHLVGMVGNDGLPDTADDLPGHSNCVRREIPISAGTGDWLWIEAACGSAAAEVLAGQIRWQGALDLSVVGLLVRR